MARKKKPIAPSSRIFQRKKKQLSDEDMTKALDKAAKGEMSNCNKYKVPLYYIKR